MRNRLAVVASVLFCAPALGDTFIRNHGVDLGPVTTLECEVGTTCRRTGSNGFIAAETTTGPLDLFVDKAGNDSNSCRDAGVGACLTITGAKLHLPQTIYDPVRIFIDGGTYSEDLVFDSLRLISRPDSGTAGTISFFGWQQERNIASDAGHGTIASYDPALGLNAASVMFSATLGSTAIDDPSIFLLSVTPPDGGAVKRSIMTYSTALGTGPYYLASALSPTPLAGEAYVITQPAVLLAGTLRIQNLLGPGVMAFTDVWVYPAGTTITNTPLAAVSFTRSILWSSSGTPALQVNAIGAVNISQTSIVSQSGAADFNFSTNARSAVFSANSLLASNVSPTANAQLMNIGVGAGVVSGSPVLNTNSYNAAVLLASGFTGTFAMPSRIRCNSNGAIGTGAQSYGIDVRGGGSLAVASDTPANTTQSSTIANLFSSAGMIVEGCTTGIRINGPALMINNHVGTTDGGSVIGCTGVDTCFDLRMGARVALDNSKGTNAIAFGVSKDGGTMIHYSVDGVPYSNTFLESLTPQAILSQPFNTLISRNPIP